MAVPPRAPRRVMFSIRGIPCHVPRAPRRYFEETSGGESLFPLIVLVGFVLASELDLTAFAVLGPDIRDSFNLSYGGFLAIIGITTAGGLLLTVPLAYYSDRLRRVAIAVAGAAIWAVFGFFTAFAFTLLFLVIVRTGAGIGRAVVTPTHNSLLSDYYPPEVRTDVFGAHAIGLHVGAAIGGILGGLLGEIYGWRFPFIIFVIPSIVFVIMGFRLREPGRGHWERAAAGASQEVVDTDEVPPSFAESIRILWQIGTLRRIWYALPFLAAAFIGLVVLTSLYYQEVFGLGDFQRGFVVALAEPGQVIALFIGIPLATRMMLRDPGAGLRMLSVVAIVIAGTWTVFAFAPSLWLAITMHCATAAFLALLLPGIYATLSLAIPPKVRSLGFSMAALFILPGLLSLYVIGGIADNYGVRIGLFIAAPIFLVGAWILASGSIYVKSDISRVWTSTAAQAEVMLKRKNGEVKLLLVRNVDVHYDNVQVLFHVDFEVDEGEIVALLGTNGAGKSTLLRAVSGLLPAEAGSVEAAGERLTGLPPHRVAARGIVQMPGGAGIFPSLTVAENLRVAGWLHRRDDRGGRQARAGVDELFPMLSARAGEQAGNLSGGQQQMLALAMAVLMRPRLLMIDELSLGLAPSVVADLLHFVDRLRVEGTTLLVVEQSVNVALEISDRAVFLERGQVRFSGPAAELIDRPDLLRSVFLGGAAGASASDPAGLGRATAGRVGAEPVGAGGPRPSAGPVLRAVGLRASFGGVRAVEGVSFDVGEGEIVGVIGPNGAGKTTLFDLLSGARSVDAGEVELAGRDVTRWPASARARRGLGRSFQDARLFPALTVDEAIGLALERWVRVRDPLSQAFHLPNALASEAAVARRVDELVELLGLGGHRGLFVRELSTGTRRVLDLACLLAFRPRVVLLDEPAAGIAQREVEQLAPLVRRIRDETGASLVVVEHDLPFVRAIADRLVAMDQGRVLADGEPVAVLDHPDVVAAYVGDDARGGRRSDPVVGPRGAP